MSRADTGTKPAQTQATTQSAALRRPSALRVSLLVVGVAAIGFLVPMFVKSQLALTLLTQAVIYAILATAIGRQVAIRPPARHPVRTMTRCWRWPSTWWPSAPFSAWAGYRPRPVRRPTASAMRARPPG